MRCSSIRTSPPSRDALRSIGDLLPAIERPDANSRPHHAFAKPSRRQSARPGKHVPLQQPPATPARIQTRRHRAIRPARLLKPPVETELIARRLSKEVQNRQGRPQLCDSDPYRSFPSHPSHSYPSRRRRKCDVRLYEHTLLTRISFNSLSRRFSQAWSSPRKSFCKRGLLRAAPCEK